jgi:hypothetical protein
MTISYTKGPPKVIRLIQALAFSMMLVGFTAANARADLSVTLGAITPDSMDNTVATMDITLTSSSSFTLSQFGLELLITQTGASGGTLQFSSSQPDPYSNSNYVFSGQSFGSDNGLPFWDSPTPTSTPNDIIGGDAQSTFYTIPPGYVTIAGGVTEYLATVQFYVPSDTQLNSFQVSLVSGPNTFFLDQNGNPLPLASGVPEPSSLAVVALSSLTGLLWFWRGRRQRRS